MTKRTEIKLRKLIRESIKQQLNENDETIPFDINIKNNENVILQNNGDISIHISKDDFKAFKTILKNNGIKYEIGLF